MKKLLAIVLTAMLCLGVITAVQGETSLRQVYQYTVDGNFAQIYGSNHFEYFSEYGGGYALMSLDGRVLTEEIYDNIQEDYGCFTAVLIRKPECSGALNAEGQAVIPFEYHKVSILNETWGLGIRFKKVNMKADADYIYYTGSGEEYYQIESADVYNLKEGKLMGTLTRGQYGGANASGEYLNIKRRSGTVEQYDGSFRLLGEADSLYSFPNEEGPSLQVFYEDGKYGLADEASGHVILQPQFDDIQSFEDGLARVRNGEKYGLIDRNGSIVVPAEYDDIGDFEDGFAQVEKDGKYGLIDRSGNLAVPVEFDGFDGICDSIPVTYSGDPKDIFGYVAVIRDGKTAFYSLAENQLATEFRYGEEDGAYNYGVFQIVQDDDGIFTLFAADGVETKLDAFGSCEPLVYSLGRYCTVQENETGDYGLVDWHGQEVLPCAYGGLFLTADARYLGVYEYETKTVTVYEVTDAFIPSWE